MKVCRWSVDNRLEHLQSEIIEHIANRIDRNSLEKNDYYMNSKNKKRDSK